LKRVDDDNDSVLGKKNVVAKSLENMNGCQRKFLNMRIVDLWSNQTLAKVIYNVLFKYIILLIQDHADGRLYSSQIQQEIYVIIRRIE
jgi:hypothetical protein